MSPSCQVAVRVTTTEYRDDIAPVMATTMSEEFFFQKRSKAILQDKSEQETTSISPFELAVSGFNRYRTLWNNSPFSTTFSTSIVPEDEIASENKYPSRRQTAKTEKPPMYGLYPLKPKSKVLFTGTVEFVTSELPRVKPCFAFLPPFDEMDDE